MGRRAGSETSAEHCRLAGISAFGVLALASACGGEVETKKAWGPSLVTVEFLTVEPETLRDEVALTGQLEAEYSVVLRTEIDGVIESIEFEEGQPVEEAAILFRLRDEEQQARHQEALAELRLAQDVFDRTQRLTKQDVSSVARRAKATAELDIAKARVSLAKLELERTRIRAPFAGVTGARLVAPGDRATPEDGLVSIAAVDRLQLIFTVQEMASALARIGAIIHARVASWPGERFRGEVFFISPSVDPASRRLILKAWIQNEGHRLKPGMFANVDIEIAVRPGALLVPEASIVYDRHGSYVWRITESDLAEKIPVEIGLRQRGRVEIVRGIRAGDRIVSAGTNKLMAGSRVEAPPGPPVEHARESPEPERGNGAES